MTPSEVLKFAKENGAKFVDYKFVDLLGTWQHTTMPIAKLQEDSFSEGFNFDGSSIRGWQAINESDMSFIPDATTAVMDPFYAEPTMSLICDIVDAVTRQPYTRDPRNVARKAEQYLKQTGLGDTVYFGPEPEFFVFDHVRFAEGPQESYYHIDSAAAKWNSGAEDRPNLGYKTNFKGGYFPVPPTDTFGDLRMQMALAIASVGIEVEVFHHEVATAGQNELSMRFNTLKKMADQTLWYKYCIRNVARRHGKTATFMPKPIVGDNGSGMHCHQSIWKNEKNLFAGDKYGGLSETALHYIGGLLKHAPALLAITNPTLNSYRRLVPGYEAPVNLAYSSRNRSASVRIPISGPSPKAKRLEFRCPDATTNPYLAFAAMMMAGIDGIQNKIDPGQPLDKDIYALSKAELKDVPKAPGSLEESIENLKKDHEFLLRGDVFTKDVIDSFIDWKEEHELGPSRLRTTPFEFLTYYDY